MRFVEELRSGVRGAKVGQAVLNPGYERKQTYIRAASPGHLQPALPPIALSQLFPKVLFSSGGSSEGRVLTAAAGFQLASGLLQVLWPPPSRVAARRPAPFQAH